MEPLNCPWFGTQMLCTGSRRRIVFVKLERSSTRCGLIVEEVCPCVMHEEGLKPSWQTCSVVADRYAVI
jgi:hypothetical protein